MNKSLMVALLGIVVVVCGASYFWFSQQQDKNAKEGMRQSKIAEVKNVPLFDDLSPKEAGTYAFKNLQISKVTSPETMASAEYFALTVEVTNGKNFGDLFSKIYNKPASLIIMTAQNVRSPNNDLSTPIVVFKSSATRPLIFDILHVAKGQVLPFEPSLSGRGADIALDIHYLDEKMSPKDIANFIQYSKNPLERKAELNALLKKHRRKFYNNLIQLHVGPEGKLMSGRKISLKDTDSTIELNLQSKPMRFTSIKEKGLVVVNTRKIENFLRNVSNEDKEIYANFWLNEGKGFSKTCRDISNRLQDRAGLSTNDTALVLWSLIHRHAWFAKRINYQTDCLEETHSAALKKLNLKLPTWQKRRPSSPSIAAMNSKLAALVKVIREGDLNTTKIDFGSMITEKVTLLDRANIWLSGIDVKQNDGGRIFESASRKATIDQLLSLPVSHFGCFSRGEALKGRHRKTLAQFGTSKELWELVFAFNSRGKITGITLDEATTKSVCRAIGNQRTGRNTCYFSRRGSQFPIIANAKCR